MAPPIEDLFLRIVELEESPKLSPAPSGERSESAREGEHALGGAALNRAARKAPLNVGHLSGIDVHCDHLVTRCELHGRAASGGNAEDASIWMERGEFNSRVLMHTPEKQFARPGACVEAPAFPSGGGTHFHAGKLAETQASTRKAKFLSSIPAGS